MAYIISLGLFLPLLGFFCLTFFNRWINRTVASVFACSVVFAAFLSFFSIFIVYINSGMHPEQFSLFQFVPVEGIKADFSLHLDSLSLLMTLIITGVGFLIHVYSIGYMEHEEDLVRYFAFLNFFVFSMLLLVLAGHLLVLFVGWEGVGVASYFLIGFWYTRPEAAKAATKAFVMNRIGDLGFLLALIMTFIAFGTGDIAQISESVGTAFTVGAPLITIITLLYFVGAVGKSAQLPLYSWLPDAMEGPTPVSALIHAATMVTAGVYLLVRMHALFLMAPVTLQIVGVIGGVTSLFAAICAFNQTDLKRVLAFSTVSQLGLMFLACGAGAFYSAMFHLTTHAFVKALLFLSAGNVVHMLHGTTEMAKMGGLAKIFTKTHWLFLIGALALSGLPPFAVFFSKDLILEQEYMGGHEILFYFGFAASVLTGFYMMRAYCLAFLGDQRMSAEEAKNVHEAPRIMLIPVAVLAVLAIVGGGLGYTYSDSPWLAHFLSEVGVTEVEESLRSGFAITSETFIVMACAFLAVGISYRMYTRSKPPAPIEFFKNQFFINEFYQKFFVDPLKELSYLIVRFFEPKVFEGSIEGMIALVQGGARKLQLVQNGQIRSYMAWMVFGSACLLFYLYRILNVA